STRRLRSPRLLWQPPIDPFQQISQLRRLDRHRHVRAIARKGRGPDEATALQSLRKQAHALTIVPQNLDQPAAPAAEHKQMAIVRIELERLLHQHRQAIEPLAHVGVTARKPNLHPTRDRDHCPSSASASTTARAGVTPSGRRRSRPLRSTSSITSDASTAAFCGKPTWPPSAATAIGTKRHSV